VTAYTGQVRVEGASPAPATVEPLDEHVSIAVQGGPPFVLPYVDIEDVLDRDYVLTLTDHTGRVLELSMFGAAYGQVLAEVAERRDKLLERDLLLRGVDLQDTFPAKLFDGPESVPVQLRLYRDLLVVAPERGTMFGVPFAFVEDVRWDPELYQVSVAVDDGRTLVFGHLAKRSEEFHAELGRLLEALARRTAVTLAALLPDADPRSLGGLAGLMRDGRAAQQREIEAVDPGLWPLLETAVPGTDDLRRSYQHLRSLAVPGWSAFGVKAVQESEDVADTAATDRWYFCPLTRDGRPVNAVAQEVASGEGHATYLYRPMEPDRFAALDGDALAHAVAGAIRVLNRALLQLNFRREPLYVPEEELTGAHARYRVALRKLDHLRWARAAFLGRAIHNATWEQQVADLLSRA